MKGKFVVGETYFLLGYYDEKLRLPFVKSFVFVGQSCDTAGDASGGMLFCFQDAESFVKYGPHMESDPTRDIHVLAQAVDQCDVLLDSSELAGEMSAFGEKRDSH